MVPQYLNLVVFARQREDNTIIKKMNEKEYNAIKKLNAQKSVKRDCSGADW